MKTDPKLLWVEVGGKYVYLKSGPAMPEPSKGMFYACLFSGGAGIERKEFARWSGITFPGDGVYGLRCPLAVVERYRCVEEKSYVAAEKTTRRLERM